MCVAITGQRSTVSLLYPANGRMTMTEVKTAEPFIARPNQVAAADAEDTNLPFNLSSGFGGVDATQPIFSQAALRNGLFDLTGGSTRRQKVRWGEQAAQQAEFDVPRF